MKFAAAIPAPAVVPPLAEPAPAAAVSPGRWHAWSRRIGAFFLGQGAVQLLNLVTGFFLVRWLSVEAYAQYSVAFGFQSTIGFLVDLGFSGSIVALVGARGGDPAVVGGFIRSAKHYRAMLFAVVVPVSALMFFWMAGKQGWSWPTRAALFGSVVVSLYFQGWSAYYAAPLLIHQRLGSLYQAQIGSSALRLAASAAFYFARALGATATAWINCLSMALCAVVYKARSRPFVAEPERVDPAFSRAMKRYIAPVVPGTIFYALQGQLTIFLITVFGKAQNIAEVAALGRLTQALILLGAFNGVIIEPYIARLAYARLPGRYWLIVAGGIAVAAGLTGLGFLFPSALLWVIGPKYAHLQAEFSWSIAAWGLNYLGGLLWLMHSARKWVFWWHTALCCVALTLAQVAGVWLLDLSTTTGIFKFAILTAATNVGVHVIGGICGYRAEGRGTLPADRVETPAEEGSAHA